jgi:hypothetical protein
MIATVAVKATYSRAIRNRPELLSPGICAGWAVGAGDGLSAPHASTVDNMADVRLQRRR